MPALACQGLAMGAVLRIDASRAADLLWVAEQALRCRDVGAVLVWLARARSDQLRRLHMAAQSANQAQAPLVFALRPLAEQQASSPAPLRLQLGGASGHRLELGLLKRRGPTLGRPLYLLPALPPALARPSWPPSHAVDRPRTISLV
jgi:protein ImuA